MYGRKSVALNDRLRIGSRLRKREGQTEREGRREGEREPEPFFMNYASINANIYMKIYDIVCVPSSTEEAFIVTSKFYNGERGKAKRDSEVHSEHLALVPKQNGAQESE